MEITDNLKLMFFCLISSFICSYFLLNGCGGEITTTVPSPSVPSPSLLYQKDGEAASDYFGSSVSTTGDVNGDGTPDFIVGAPGSSKGSVYVYLSK